MSEPSGLSGACSCGSVGFQANADLRRVLNCHCKMCRKMNGAAFSSYAVIPRKLLVLSGEEHVAEYQVTKAARKYFCRRCGTPLFNTNARYPGACMIYWGALGGGASATPSMNIYCESMLPWAAQISNLRRLEQGV